MKKPIDLHQLKRSLNALRGKIANGTCEKDDALVLCQSLEAIDRLIGARDEARRIACYERAINLGWTPHRIADSNLWDCFSDE